MRKPLAAAVSVAWFAAVGGTFGCLLPYLLNYWHLHQPLPYWWVARGVGAALICVGLVPVVNSFASFFKAGGTPVPPAAPPVLVVSGFYRYVRNPIYAGFASSCSGRRCCSARPTCWSTPRQRGSWGPPPSAGMRNPY